MITGVLNVGLLLLLGEKGRLMMSICFASRAGFSELSMYDPGLNVRGEGVGDLRSTVSSKIPLVVGIIRHVSEIRPGCGRVS